MFRRLISNQSGLLQSQTRRWEEIARFACLRASLNKDSAKAFADLAKQNNLTPQELTAISQVVALDLQALETNLPADQFASEKEAAQARFRDTALGTKGRLQAVHSQIVAKHPTIGTQLAEVAGYKEAYTDLKNLFLGEASAQQQLSQYLKNLAEQHKSEPKTVAAISQALNQLVDNLSADKVATQARLVTLLQTHGLIDSVQREIVFNERPETELDFNSVFIAQENQEILSKLGQGPWENDRKLVFQALANSKLELPYLLVALLCGASFAYFLYSGDAKYKTLVLTPVVGIAAAILLKKNQWANSSNVLTKLLLHKDGKHVDAVISRKGQSVTLNDLPISNLKLTKGDARLSVNIPEENFQKIFAKRGFKQENQNGDFSYSFALLRPHIAKQGQVITLGDQQVVVPFVHQGNSLLLKSIFNGTNVPASV